MPSTKVSGEVALVYLRVSTGEQERSGVGLGVQRASCREYIRFRQWHRGPEFLDVMSGDRNERPGYQELLRTVRRMSADGTEAVIVVASLDRLGRRLLEAVRCRGEMKALGVAVHSVRDGGEVPDLVANILGAVAEDELRRWRDRMQTAYRSVVAMGWYPPGACPTGYLLRPANRTERADGAPRMVLDVDPDNAPPVREIFVRATQGQKMRDISRAVQHLGGGPAHSVILDAAVISKMLRNPVYVGRMRQGSPDVLGHNRGKWPALVTLRN